MFTNTISDNTMFESPSNDDHHHQLVMEKRWKSSTNTIETAPNCPRCASSNTKFCYYNNYSLSQPRYFCKGCRRYWTKGGSLRNVPVGGGCRKSRKSRSARLQADQRSGLSYQVPSPGTSYDSSGTSGVNIDLAAVFANFLSQDSSNINNNDVVDEVNNNNDSVSVLDQDQSSSSGVSNNSLDHLPQNSNFGPENMILDCQNSYDQFIIDDHGDHQMMMMIHEGLPPLCMDNGENGTEEFLDQNCDALDNLQAIFGGGDDVIGQQTHLLTDIEWQSIIQFQDFGSSSSSNYHFNNNDDHMKIPSSDLLADHHDENWSSFDHLSGYDILPRPWN